MNPEELWKTTLDPVTQLGLRLGQTGADASMMSQRTALTPFRALGDPRVPAANLSLYRLGRTPRPSRARPTLWD